MNEYEPQSEYAFLFEILDKFSTDKLKLYYLACAETGDDDGKNIADTILRCRGASYEAA